MSQQYVKDENGMYEAQYSTRGPASFRKWYTCRICSLDFPEDEVVLEGGSAFCIRYGHNLIMHKQRTGGKI